MWGAAAAEGNCCQECEDGHHNDECAHSHLDGNRKHDDLAVREENCASQQNSKDRPGSPDCWYVRGPVPPENRDGIHEDVYETGSSSSEEVILQETGTP